MTWIKCSEKLPEESKVVLVANSKDIYKASIGWKNDWLIEDDIGCTCYMNDSLLSFNEITHWQPLPELPNEENV